MAFNAPTKILIDTAITISALVPSDILGDFFPRIPAIVAKAPAKAIKTMTLPTNVSGFNFSIF